MISVPPEYAQQLKCHFVPVVLLLTLVYLVSTCIAFQLGINRIQIESWSFSHRLSHIEQNSLKIYSRTSSTRFCFSNYLKFYCKQFPGVSRLKYDFCEQDSFHKERSEDIKLMMLVNWNKQLILNRDTVKPPIQYSNTTRLLSNLCRDTLCAFFWKSQPI